MVAAKPSPLSRAATNFAPGSQSAIAYLNQLLASRGVDVKAADSVFGREGASGGIGDGGHAFGPGQFNDAGGVWTGRYPGLSPQQKNAQAWSPSGLQELAQRVAAVAAGLHGSQAVQSIVTRFERPANPQGEIAGALSAYGLPMQQGGSFQLGGGAATAAPSLPVAAAAPRPDLGALLDMISPTGQLSNPGEFISGLKAYRQPLQAAWGPPGRPTVGGKAGQGQKGLPPLKAPAKGLSA
jgi:hypothetical protein